MLIATLTSTGQLTIPKDVREQIGLRQGDRVGFLIEPDGTVHLRTLARSVRNLAGFLYRPSSPPVTLEEMAEALLERMEAEEGRIWRNR